MDSNEADYRVWQAGDLYAVFPALAIERVGNKRLIHLPKNLRSIEVFETLLEARARIEEIENTKALV